MMETFAVQADFLGRKNRSRRQIQPLPCCGVSEFMAFWPKYACFRHRGLVLVSLKNSLMHVPDGVMQFVLKWGEWRGVMFVPNEEFVSRTKWH